MMESRAGEANRLTAPGARVVIGTLPRRSEPVRHQSLALGAVLVESLTPSGRVRFGLEHAILLPYGPDDAGEFVGEADGGFVVTAPVLELECPDTERVWLLGAVAAPEDGAGAVGEEHTQIGIATFADAP